VTPTPGVTVTSGASAPSSSFPTDTGQWFVTGEAEKGPTDAPVLVRNLAQYVTTFGARVAYGYLYDALQTFFKEGGSRAYVARVVGPSAKVATVKLSDGSKDTLQVNAISPGAWGNDLTVKVDPGSGDFVLTVELDEEVVETSPTLNDNGEAVTWALSSSYIRLVDLGNGDPAEAIKELASGTDDRENITEEEWLDALNLFEPDLGPGQVSAPGRTTAESQENLLTHAGERNRVALLDGTDTETVGTLISQAATLRAIDNARFGGLFGPWAVIPGLTAGTTRTVPYSAVQAGLTARSDVGGNPNEAVAGVSHVARYATDLSQAAWTAVERGELSDAGVNVARVVNGAVETYDDITLVNPLVDATWLFLSNARLNMALAAGFAAVGERHLFAQIDGRGIELGKFGGDLVGEVLLPLYEAGALFGDSPEDAFACDTSDQVNTEETIAEGKILANVSVRMSPAGRFVEIELSKEAI
jgi:phage tail sheath protein FI